MYVTEENHGKGCDRILPASYILPRNDSRKSDVTLQTLNK